MNLMSNENFSETMASIRGSSLMNKEIQKDLKETINNNGIPDA